MLPFSKIIGNMLPIIGMDGKGVEVDTFVFHAAANGIV
jgi:hypothetical protein